MAKKITLKLSDKASDNLETLSKALNITVDEFASVCFEYVDIKHQGIVAAVQRLIQSKQPEINKENLNEHLKKLSADQIELLLQKAAQKRKRY
jgi:hypothetical protein